jgi:hypothetical protein
MKPVGPLVALALVASTAPARAAAVAALEAKDQPVIHEDYLFVVHDAAAKREHLVFAARLVPSASRLTVGVPTIGAPTIKALESFDPGVALHALVAPYELRTRGRAPAVPAAWPMRDLRVTGTSGLINASDVLFDAAWMKAYADRGFTHIAMLAVESPADGRLEVSTPAVQITFDAERAILPRREPSRPSQPTEDEPEAEGPALPLEVSNVHAEPRAVGPSAEAIAKVLRGRSGPLLSCYEIFLEKRPGEATKVRLEAAIRPKGDTASLRATDAPSDEVASAFAACVVKEAKKKQFPRTDEGWRFTADLDFKPPRTPARRTHVVLVGTARQVWRSPPRSARILDDFEASAADVARAFGEELTRALGLADGQRLWVTHWLDRDERRALAEDALFDREDLPADGEPGTLSFRPEQKPAAAAPTPAPRAAPRPTSRRGRTAMALSTLVAALTVALALWLAREQRPRRP